MAGGARIAFLVGLFLVTYASYYPNYSLFQLGAFFLLLSGTWFAWRKVVLSERWNEAPSRRRESLFNQAGASFKNLFSLSGEVSRDQYVYWGLVLFFLKNNIDRLVASHFFGKTFEPISYLVPSQALSIFEIPKNEFSYFLVFVFCALPFIAAGVILTVKRLRNVGWPSWLCCMFFIPFLNLVLFAVLSVMPEQKGSEEDKLSFLDQVIPESAFGSAVLSLIIPSALGGTAVYVVTNIFENYGWSIFVGWPFLLGFVGTIIYCHHELKTSSQVLKLCSTIILLNGLILITFAIEGLVCLVMAAPIAWGLAVTGGFIAHSIVSNAGSSPKLYSMVLVMPLITAFDIGTTTIPKAEPVTTEIIVDAPIHTVWRNVLEFSELPKPNDWILRLGFAYPRRARIEGHGVGAIRYCEFTTGPFVEPIEVWDEPYHLKFSVESQPPAMTELNPLGEVFSPHVDDYLVSEGGEFKLSKTSDGKVLVKGTTWYRHKIWPKFYWRFFSDEVIHRIHLQVLRHIKRESERSLHR